MVSLKPIRDRSRLLIYGAYGYTGRLIALEAASRGMSPILSGRDPARTHELAERLGFESRPVDLGDTAALDELLEDVAAVLHCAGPFSQTHRQMAEACLRTETHYLDVSGEVPVYQSLASMDSVARERGIMLLPGIGFDVVPTDCIAARLKLKMPDATHLTLALQSVGPATVSRGTAKTVLEGLAQPALIRRDGALVPVPHLSASQRIDFGDGEVIASRMIVADVFSAYHSTGIPNIETYVALPTGARVGLKVVRRLKALVSSGSIRSVIHHAIDVLSAGPSDEARLETYTRVWGQVRDEAGSTLEETMRLPEAYAFTALAGVSGAQRVLEGETRPGYQTPTTAFGADFVSTIPGVDPLDPSLAAD